MMQAMGILRTSMSVGSLTGGAPLIPIEVMVDTGSEYNWVPSAVLESLGIARVRRDRFETADGRVLERDFGFAMIYAGDRSAAAAVVFGEPDDMTLLGAIGLESLNLRVDLGRKELVPTGPVPAAVIGRSGWAAYGSQVYTLAP
ncbi:MAG TPA: aspartyl protease family protein [Gemmatimonadaceae bacterium]|jgi:predicted aspartyl protease